MPTARRQRTLMSIPTPRLAAWYDAGTLALVDTNAVPAWEDTTRLSAGVVQGTGANQPIYKHNGTDDINGLPVVQFDGTDDDLRSAVVPVLFSEWSIFAVFRPDTTTVSQAIFGMGAGTTFRRLSPQLNTTWVLYYADNSTDNPAVAIFTNGVPCLLSLVSNRNFFKIYVNGVLRRTVAARGAMSSALIPTFSIGSTGNQDRFKSQLAELRIYRGALPDGQRQAEELRLNTKYALF